MERPAPKSVRHRVPGLQTKVAFLSGPEAYPERPEAVEVVQTHMSCVFLTDRHAYKLKKPVRHDFLDFSTLEARRSDCEEELRLNRRLARDVYIGVVPLAWTREGGLAVGGDGEIVDWLVKMRRLPARLMLDRAIRDGNVRRDDVRRCARVLADFYRRAEPVATDPGEYRDRFRTDILANQRALAAPRYGLSPALLASVTARLSAALEREASSFDRRVAERRIVEGHGDLRPEHVCLGAEPLFIDCLEFNPKWRMLDPADELAYLAMECEFAGAPWIGEVVLDTYREATGDDPPARLLGFYKGVRAQVRAKLSAWHLKDHPDPADRRKWIARAGRYLELANRHAVAASGQGSREQVNPRRPPMSYRKKAAKKTALTRPAMKPSPELSAAIRAVAAAGRRKPRPTLARVRATLQREGTTWSREGELLFPQDRTALLIEVDELIDAYGARADAAGLVARRGS